MKGTFFNKPLEWNITTTAESWQQGERLDGTLTVKNHGLETVSLAECGAGITFAEIKKVQARTSGSLSPAETQAFIQSQIQPGEEAHLAFSFPLPLNGNITDKKSSYYLTYGRQFSEAQLQVAVIPKELYSKIIGLLDTFMRFKVKEIKAGKKGVEYKLLPPTARDMANIESLLLTFSMQDGLLKMKFQFQVKRLDTASVTTKINKESLTLEKDLTAREYSLGGNLINQDTILKNLESIMAEVKMKSVF